MKKFFIIAMFSTLLIIIYLFPDCQNWRCTKIKIEGYKIYQSYLEKSNNIKKCNIPNIGKINKNSILIIGHAYGNDNNTFIDEDEFLDRRIIDIIKKEKNNINTVIFNGDVFYEPSKKKWSSLIKFFDEVGIDLYIAPGNHDIKFYNNEESSKNLFTKFFDLEYPKILNRKHFDLIIRDSINMGWSPKKKEINLINSILKKKNLIIVQHHTALNELRFLTNDKAKKRTKANKKIVDLDSFAKTLEKKGNLTFLIGDAGLHDHHERLECKTKHNLNYVINGLGGFANDKILIIHKNYIYSYDLV